MWFLIISGLIGVGFIVFLFIITINKFVPKVTIKDIKDVDIHCLEKITQQTITMAVSNSHMCRGSVRISTGKIYTDEDIELLRKQSLSINLP